MDWFTYFWSLEILFWLVCIWKAPSVKVWRQRVRVNIAANQADKEELYYNIRNEYSHFKCHLVYVIHWQLKRWEVLDFAACHVIFYILQESCFCWLHLFKKKKKDLQRTNGSAESSMKLDIAAPPKPMAAAG